MRPFHTSLVAIPVLGALILSACSTGNSRTRSTPATSPSATVSAPISSSSAITSAAPTSLLPAPVSSSPAAVPVDQIPPGNPASWVPAGVSLIAPYREAGDQVPKFTPAMFTNTQLGAEAMAAYYIQADNWASATNDPVSFTIICSADKCAREAKFFKTIASAGQHLSGQRIHPTGTTVVIPSPNKSVADWVVQRRLAGSAGRLLGIEGVLIQAYPAPKAQVTNCLLKWNGHMWRVVGDYLAA